MRLPHRLQGQKVKSQGGAGAYCGGDLAAQLVKSRRKKCRILTQRVFHFTDLHLFVRFFMLLVVLILDISYFTFVKAEVTLR